MYIVPLSVAQDVAARSSDDRRVAFPLAWILLAMAGSAALTLGLLVDGRIVVHLFTPAATPVLIWLALTFGATWLLRDAAGARGQAVADCALHYGLITTMSLMGAVATYPVAGLSRGFVDGTLERIDLALRFDWLAWYEAVAAHPMLQVVGHIAYQSIYLSPAILFAWFAWQGRRADARAFLSAYWLAAFVTIALFGAMPAEGPFALLWHRHIPYMPDSGLWQPELIPALRHHAVHAIDLGELRGLVSAPSFHTAAAVLYIVTAWPIRRLRWPLLGLNVAMLASTPVEGTHYLVDMLLGALVAAVALTAVAALRSFREGRIMREAAIRRPRLVR